MRVESYDADLIQRLENAEYAREYLAQLIEQEDRGALLLGLKFVIDAQGGIGRLSKKLGVTRQSLYKAFSKKGNPTIETLFAVLRGLGFELSICKRGKRAA